MPGIDSIVDSGCLLRPLLFAGPLQSSLLFQQIGFRNLQDHVQGVAHAFGIGVSGDVRCWKWFHDFGLLRILTTSPYMLIVRSSKSTRETSCPSPSLLFH